MPKTVVEKAVCDNCGADIRENTAFCYNCGSALAADIEDLPPPPADVEPDAAAEVDAEVSDDRGRAALDDLAERLQREEEESDKLAKAAAERKRARIRQRQPKEVRWEADDSMPGVPLIIATLLLALIALLVVLFTVYWR